MNAKKLLCLLLCALMLTLAACGASARAENEMMYDSGTMAPAEAPETALGQSSPAASTLPADRKLIRTIYLEAETEELDPLLETLNQQITGLGGYVQSKNLYNGSTYSSRRTRHMNMTIRVPAENADALITHLSGQTNVVSSNESIDDVTLQYVDTESRVKALETEQARLMELLEKANSLTDILEIESRLTQVRYELESYASRLRTLDNQITYATIHLTVTEVTESTPVEVKTPWQRIGSGFVSSIRQIGRGIVECFVWVLSNSPFLVLWGGIGFGALFLVRKIRAKRPGKEAKKNPPEQKQ